MFLGCVKQCLHVISRKEVVILCFARLWYLVWDPGVLCLEADLQQTVTQSEPPATGSDLSRFGPR